MAVYMVTYDLFRPGQDYEGLIEEIKKLGAWWYYLKSSWLVDAQLNATQINQRLRPHYDNTDRILIIKVTRDYDGWLPQDAWAWIKNRL